MRLAPTLSAPVPGSALYERPWVLRWKTGGRSMFQGAGGGSAWYGPATMRGTVRVVVAVGALLTACSSGSSSVPSRVNIGPVGPSAGPEHAAFCQHYNGALLDALNAMSEGPANDIDPSLAALKTAAVYFEEDTKSHDAQVKAFSFQVLEAIVQQSQMLHEAGTLSIIDQKGLAPKLTDVTIAVGDYC
ncbi:MAG: hypothetical protein M3P11_06950 [Actinomycetota bacterium]|nr:hypothetical protein [Actinomycetota bacterium]